LGLTADALAVARLRRAGRDEVCARVPAPDAAEMRQFSLHSYGAQFAEVRQNAVTCEIRVSRFLGSVAAHRPLTPAAPARA